MSYDPRKGDSPYLGFETEGETSTQLMDERGRGHATRDVADAAPATATRRVNTSPRTAHRTPAERTTQMAPATVQRPQPRRGSVSRPDATSAIRRTTTDARRRPSVPVDQRRRVVPSPPQPPNARRSGPFAALASLGLRALSLCARLAAITISLLVIVASFGANRHRAIVVSLFTRVSALIPAGLQGRLVVETPFGGAFRGDLAVLAVVLFLIDWFCLSYAYSLANSRERGA